MPTKIEKDALTGTNTTGHEWDGLKELNDREGELEGDDALRRLGGMLANALEPTDELARVGGAPCAFVR